MKGRFQSLSLPSLEMTDNTLISQCLYCSLNREEVVVDPMYLSRYSAAFQLEKLITAAFQGEVVRLF